MSILHRAPYEWLVGLRYTRAGRRSGRNSFISFISLISVAGIGLGVAALIVVLSVMNGFQKEVTDRMLSVLSHIEVYDAAGSMTNWQTTAQQAFGNPEVKGAAPFVETQGMLLHDDVMRPVLIHGILPAQERTVSELANEFKQGSLEQLTAGSSHIAIGTALASALGVKLGDKLTLALAQDQAQERASASTALMPRLRTFTVTGIFEAGHNEFDSGYAFMHLDDAEQLEHLTGPSGLRLRVADMHHAPQVAHQLMQTLSGDFLIRDWSKLNPIWFAALETQKTMMFIILGMIIAVAAFNLVSTLVMTVTDKQADIAILRTLGASPRSIMKIFMVQGVLVGTIGVALGVLLGVLVSDNIHVIVPAIEHALGMKFLSKDIYFISTVPSDLRWSDVSRIGGVALMLAFFATLYPSWSAARVNPAQALRYE